MGESKVEMKIFYLSSAWVVGVEMVVLKQKKNLWVGLRQCLEKKERGKGQQGAPKSSKKKT